MDREIALDSRNRAPHRRDSCRQRPRQTGPQIPLRGAVRPAAWPQC